MDDYPVHVRDDQKRRIFQRYRVLLQLGIGGRQVLAFSLILPPKMPALPGVSPAFASGRLRRTSFKAIPSPRLVRVCWSLDFEKVAQVVEVRLGGRPLGQG
ncbi:hypothetical protein D3C86_1085940 [compost metagenome]